MSENATVDEANEILRGKGYREAQLGVFSTPMPTKLLIKGAKIGSPFADSPEVVLRAVRDCVPSADDLGKHTITPHELRSCLEQA